jgi:hypothetical protein
VLVLTDVPDDRADRAVAIMERYVTGDSGVQTGADTARERRHAGMREVEEVVVHKDVQEQTETVRDTVRCTEREVEAIGAGRAGDVGGFYAYEADFRGHYTASLAGRTHPYEHWAPGYRCGYELASDLRYAGRDWAALEVDARRDWEGRRGGLA